MENKVNIKQIAELAGVSVATVSRVINQNGRFSAETEQRIKDIIKEYNYVPNIVAKGLRTNKTPVIGIIVPDIVNNHFAKLVLELEKVLFEQGYSTVICNTNESLELEKRHIQTLVSQQVAGIMFISGKRRYDIEKSIPVIYVDRRPDDEYADAIVIESDNEEGGYLAARRLLEKGCKNIAVLLASGIDYNHRARLQGYRRALSEFHIEFKSEWAIDVEEVSFEAAETAVRNAMENGIDPDAVMCTTDTLAIGAILGLRKKNRRVPEDVLVAGFDDTALAAAYNPAISSVHQFVDKMAECAVDTLLKLIKKSEIGKTYYMLPVELVERESTRDY